LAESMLPHKWPNFFKVKKNPPLPNNGKNC
jgi:hypothetical protein